MKVVFDVNIWISFAIGKKVGILKTLLLEKQIVPVYSTELAAELIHVLKRPKFKKLISSSRISETLQIFKIFGIFYKIIPSGKIINDPKDIYLMDLCRESHAKYLVTGDKYLLAIKKVNGTLIVSFVDFVKLI